MNHTKHLNTAEIKSLEELLETSSTRDSLIIKIALKTGARASEVVKIKNSDLNPKDNTILIHGTKGSDTREVPVKPSLMQKLVKYANSVEGDLLFPITTRMLGHIWQFHRPVNKKLHSLRHTYAIELYKKTKNILLVKRLLGHRSINNTMIYADYIDTKTALKRAAL